MYADMQDKDSIKFNSGCNKELCLSQLLKSIHCSLNWNFIKWKVSYSAKAVSNCCSEGLKCGHNTVGTYREALV